MKDEVSRMMRRYLYVAAATSDFDLYWGGSLLSQAGPGGEAGERVSE